MSWTWRDLERDDSVWRFAPESKENFFQSGRHAAEERFWKLKIHEDGSFKRRNASSLDNFYTIKDALRKEEEEEEKKRREGSVEENSRKSTEPEDHSSSSSSSSSSESESDSEEKRGDETRHKKKKKQKKKLMRKEGEDEQTYKTDVEKARDIRIRELERREIEKMRELERRERELEEREREIDRRSREQTPDYGYYYRARRNSDISNKDYPYSDYTPSIAPIQEENNHGKRRAKEGTYPYETYSTRYY